MSDEPKTLDEAKAIIRERDVEIRMLAAAGIAKAAARAATAAGKKPLMKTEFDKMTPQKRMQTMKLIASGDSDYQLVDDRDL
jgi:hypothetical protein